VPAELHPIPQPEGSRFPSATPHGSIYTILTTNLTQTNTDRIKPYKTKISTQTRPMDIMQHIASKGASLHCPTRAPRPENMPRGPSAPHAPSMPGAQCGRDRAKQLRADPPDPHIDGKPVPSTPRRYAACSWTPRFTRAMACDRGCSRSASQRRYGRATCGPQHSRLERAATDVKCRVCSGDGTGSMGRAARPCAHRTRDLTFTHTGSPRISPIPLRILDTTQTARVEQGSIPCSCSLETLIKRAQMTYRRQ
jgi:hypothetical protein